jgi:hypothetical protein
VFALNYQAESYADVDRYFLTSYGVVAAFAALGVTRALREFAPKRYGGAMLASALVLAAFCAHEAWIDFGDLARERQRDSASAWIERVRASTPADAIIIANWHDATPLAYAAYAEHRLDRRIVETAWIDDDRSYLDAWLSQYPVYVATPWAPALPGYRFDPMGYEMPRLYRVRPIYP